MAGKTNTRQPAGKPARAPIRNRKISNSFASRPEGEALRTNQGVKIADNQNTLARRSARPLAARRFHHA